MMIFCFGYLSYVISEVAENSGIISLLTAGVVMAHYTWYNLSPQGKQSSFIVFQFLGYATEAFVFGYLGLTFFSYQNLKWSPMLFGIELLVIIFGRLLGTVGLVWFLRIFGYKQEMSMKELIFVWYAGMIRGAIAFGLVLRIDGTQYKNRDVIVTTSLALVVFTTVFYGSTVGMLSNCLFKNEEHEPCLKEHKKKNGPTEPLI
jgi:solute carrier family 9 (sodium/hydrogen exchanger), member 8